MSVLATIFERGLLLKTGKGFLVYKSNKRATTKERTCSLFHVKLVIYVMGDKIFQHKSILLKTVSCLSEACQMK